MDKTGVGVLFEWEELGRRGRVITATVTVDGGEFYIPRISAKYFDLTDAGLEHIWSVWYDGHRSLFIGSKKEMKAFAQSFALGIYFSKNAQEHLSGETLAGYGGSNE